MTRVRVALRLFVLFVLLARLPLIGAALVGIPLDSFEEPLARPGHVEHADFSWPLFVIGAGIVVGGLTPLAVRLLSFRGDHTPLRSASTWPWWGSAGGALLLASWFVAWAPVDALAPIRAHTFTPIWAGYVLLVNGWAMRRTGSCLLRRPGFVALTLLSAIFWWFFEYLNRFVESWSYAGADLEGVLGLVLFGTLPFATVLPAVLSTQDLLATYPRLVAPFEHYRPVRIRHARALGAIAIGLCCIGIAMLSVAPNLLFPLPWFAPLGGLVGLSAFLGETHVLSDLGRGDWRLVVSLGLSALACGFLWEMWNAHSVARWSYAIPFVGRFHVFEMPLLGYAGYLPFGVECGMVAALVGVDARQRFG